MKTKTLVKLHLLFWLSPVALWTLYLCLSHRPHYVSWAQWIYVGILPLFGPYATFMAIPADLPNAGKFSRLYWALGLTAAMLIVALPYLTKVKWLRVVSIILYIPLILFWLFYGVVQIGSCLT